MSNQPKGAAKPAQTPTAGAKPAGSSSQLPPVSNKAPPSAKGGEMNGGSPRADNNSSMMGKSQISEPNHQYEDPSRNQFDVEGILVKYGLVEAYESVLRSLCEAGLPEGNPYELAALKVLKFEKTWKAKKKTEELKKKVAQIEASPKPKAPRAKVRKMGEGR